MQLNECLCDWQEQPSTGTVKGYTLVTECEPCKARREQANADKAAADAEALKVKEVEDMIEAKKREIAVAALQDDGHLDHDCKITTLGRELLTGISTKQKGETL